MKPHTREFTAILAAALVLAALAVVSLFIGSYPLSVGEIFDILTRSEEHTSELQSRI